MFCVLVFAACYQLILWECFGKCAKIGFSKSGFENILTSVLFFRTLKNYKKWVLRDMLALCVPKDTTSTKQATDWKFQSLRINQFSRFVAVNLLGRFCFFWFAGMPNFLVCFVEFFGVQGQRELQNRSLGQELSIFSFCSLLVLFGGDSFRLGFRRFRVSGPTSSNPSFFSFVIVAFFLFFSKKGFVLHFQSFSASFWVVVFLCKTKTPNQIVFISDSGFFLF